MSLTDFQESEPRSDKPRTANNEDQRTTYKNHGSRQSRRRHVIYVEHTSPPRFSRRREILFLTNDSASKDMVMSIGDLFAAVKSREFDFDDTSSMSSTPFCRVCLNNGHKTSIFQQVRIISSFIRNTNGNFEPCETDKRARTDSFVKATKIVCTIGMAGRIATVYRRQTEVRSGQLVRAA